MRQQLKRELNIFLQYFVIAFIAEIGAFFVWVSERAGFGDVVYSLYSMFFVYEKPRLLWWFITF
jgi:hypothetical protein